MNKNTANTGGKTYAGLDVPLEETAVCIVDDTGTIVFERRVATDPQMIAKYLVKHAPALCASVSRAAPHLPGCGASFASSACQLSVSTVAKRIECYR